MKPDSDSTQSCCALLPPTKPNTYHPQIREPNALLLSFIDVAPKEGEEIPCQQLGFTENIPKIVICEIYVAAWVPTEVERRANNQGRGGCCFLVVTLR